MGWTSSAFVDAARIAPRLGEVVLADVRWSLDGAVGHADHLERTLPGALWVDLDTVLSDPPSPADGRHPLPSPTAFAARLGRLGIPEDVPVVAFDQGPGVVAARLVWMLRAIGQPAAVLDGGLAAWDGPTAPGGATRPAVERAPRPWPADRLADADLVARLAADPGSVVVDARDPARFRGDDEPVDARPGHVPGACNLPATDNLHDGRLRPSTDLRDAYAAVGALAADEVAAYCGSGVTACLDLLVLEELGVQGRLYPGSWSAWSADPDRPAARGDGPGGPTSR